MLRARRTSAASHASGAHGSGGSNSGGGAVLGSGSAGDGGKARRASQEHKSVTVAPPSPTRRQVGARSRPVLPAYKITKKMLEEMYTAIPTPEAGQERTLTKQMTTLGYRTSEVTTKFGKTEEAPAVLDIWVAAHQNRIDDMEFLLKASLMRDPDARPGIAPNDTPLHRAAGAGHVEMAKMLIDNHASVNAADANGMTPLHFAALGGFTDMVDLLLDRGASTNVANRDGNLPKDLARLKGRHELAAKLSQTRP